MILRSPFFGKGITQPFLHFFIEFCLETALHNRRSMSSNLFAFQTSTGILSRPTDFLLLIFFNTASRPSSVNCHSLTSSWLLILFWIGLSIISKRFLTRFWKFSFNFRNLSSWQETFSFALVEFFIPLTSFTAMLIS